MAITPSKIKIFEKIQLIESQVQIGVCFIFTIFVIYNFDLSAFIRLRPKLALIRVEVVEAIMHHKVILGAYDNWLRPIPLNTCYVGTRVHP